MSAIRRLGLAAACVLGLVVSEAANAQITLFDGSASYDLAVRSYRDIPFRSVVRQQYDYSCGSAALATLLSYHYRRPVGEAAIFQAMYAVGDQAKIRRLGFSLLDMKRYLAGRGIQADGYRYDVADLAQLGSPAIAVIDTGAYRHFVVVKGVRNGRVLVGDPSQGLKIYKAEEFRQVWSGVLFMVHGAVQGTFNADQEWAPWATAPLAEPMNDASLAAFTRDLPPLYQIAPLAAVIPANSQ